MSSILEIANLNICFFFFEEILGVERGYEYQGW